jgi:hypothetical protein
MREDAFKQWVDANPPGERRGRWIPFLDGVRFLSYAAGALHGQQFELRLFHNGALSFTTDLTLCLVPESPESRQPASPASINLAATKKVIDIYALALFSKVIELLGIAGPVTIKVELYGAAGLNAIFKAEGRPWFVDPEKGPSPLSLGLTAFQEESDTGEILGHRQQLLSRLVDRLASAFGMWRIGT